MKHRQPLRSIAFLLGVALLAAACHRHKNGRFVVVSNTFEVEPNDESATPNYLGVLREDEVIVVEGRVDSVTDPFDGFAISLVRPTEVQFQLTFDDFDGELDVWVYDPAIDDIALRYESDFSPESGTFFVDDPVLDFQIVVHAFDGLPTDYRLEVYGIDSVFATASPAAGAEGAWSESLRRSGPVAEREDRAAFERARDRYLGRTIAERVEDDEAPIRTGVLFAIGEDGAVEELPVFASPGGGQVAVIAR